MAERLIKVWTQIHNAEGYLVGKKRTLLTPFRTPPRLTEVLRELLPNGDLHQEFLLKKQIRREARDRYKLPYQLPVGDSSDCKKGY